MIVLFLLKIKNIIYIFWKKKYQYIIKKWCLIYLVKKEKYINYENLPFKYINNGNYFIYLCIYNFC